MANLEDLEKRIEKIEKRNENVAADKAWETSWSRKLLLLAFTYIAIGLYMEFILNINPWINAIVPSLGFMLSTLSLPYFKKLWKKYLYK